MSWKKKYNLKTPQRDICVFLIIEFTDSAVFVFFCLILNFLNIFSSNCQAAAPVMENSEDVRFC